MTLYGICRKEGRCICGLCYDINNQATTQEFRSKPRGEYKAKICPDCGQAVKGENRLKKHRQAHEDQKKREAEQAKEQAMQELEAWLEVVKKNHEARKKRELNGIFCFLCGDYVRESHHFTRRHAEYIEDATLWA